jgi:hypothetical protein
MLIKGVYFLSNKYITQTKLSAQKIGVGFQFTRSSGFQNGGIN